MKGFKIVLIPLASPLHNPQLVDPVLKRIKEKLLDLIDYSFTKIVNLSSINHDIAKKAEVFIISVLTGGTEGLIIELVERYRKPVILIAHDSQNSLAAALEAYSVLVEKGYYGKLILENEINELRYIIKAIRVLASLKNMKFISIGKPSPWLIYSKSVEPLIERDLGVKVEYSSIDELLSLKPEKVEDVELNEILRKWGLLQVRKYVSHKDIEESLKFYLALKRLIDKYKAKIITIRCFDLLKYNVTACLPLSLLNSEGVIAGCEADIPATISLAILSFIAEKPSFMANVVWLENNRILFAHCTIALRLVQNFTLKSHFESGLGVAIEGYPKKGEVATFMRLDPKKKILTIGKGTVLNDKPLRYDNCRTQIVVEVEGNAKKMLKTPIGNHFVLTYGDHTKPLMYFAEIIGYKINLI